MLVTGFPAGPWGANCFVIAPEAGSECLVVDPGMDSTDGIAEIVREHRLRPVAVLLSHGHIDHTWSVVPVTERYRIPAYIHPADRDLLSDPMSGMSTDIRAMLAQLGPESRPNVEPSDVAALSDGLELDLAGIRLTAAHAPGHTPGSTLFKVAGEGDFPSVLFTGDVLFAGSIGRTDLPGGDHAAMMDSLAGVVLPLPDETVVLPGHGSQTTIGQERVTNPFLIGLPAGKSSGRSP